LKESTITTPKKETPNKETPKKETPKKDSSKKETPKKETPKKETPKKETPKKETPKKDSSKKETPKKETPKKETPKKDISKNEETYSIDLINTIYKLSGTENFIDSLKALSMNEPQLRSEMYELKDEKSEKFWKIEYLPEKDGEYRINYGKIGSQGKVISKSDTWININKIIQSKIKKGYKLMNFDEIKVFSLNI
jgi:predicted DNA-binding WGR domain protein